MNLSAADRAHLARWEAELAGQHMWVGVPAHGGWSCVICSTLVTSGDDCRIRMACPGPVVGQVAS